MIIYNVTVNIDEDAAADWLKWMKEVHIPDVLNTGMFLESRLTRVLAEEEGGMTFSVQYLCESMETYERYREEHAPRLQQGHEKRYQGKFAAFRTLLRVEDISSKIKE